MTAFVVESEARDVRGVRRGKFRVYVASEARAQEIVAQAPGRTYREIPLGEMPEAARENLIRARREQG